MERLKNKLGVLGSKDKKVGTGKNSQREAGAASSADGNDKASSHNAGSDSMYVFDEEALEKVREAKPWMKNAKHFKKVQVSACATMKMLMHAVSGVEKGMKEPMGKPVEVMGLMLGRPSLESPDTLCVMDVFPLPVEGAETRVLADDQEVMNYMINLGESLELTRDERFMGWYHSHPFDVEVFSHCHLSATDVTTQLGWQRAEDRNGNPWLAIVVDPLRSLAKGKPEMGAFRAYPPEFTNPPNETPDGKIVTDDAARIERWGVCWNRYHELEIEYFMSSLSSNVLNVISKKFLWMNNLSSTPTMEKEYRDRFADRISGSDEKLRASSRYLERGGAIQRSFGRNSTEDSGLEKSVLSLAELSIEQLQSQTSQVSKSMLFCPPKSNRVDNTKKMDLE